LAAPWTRTPSHVDAALASAVGFKEMSETELNYGRTCSEFPGARDFRKAARQIESEGRSHHARRVNRVETKLNEPISRCLVAYQDLISCGWLMYGRDPDREVEREVEQPPPDSFDGEAHWYIGAGVRWYP